MSDDKHHWDDDAGPLGGLIAALLALVILLIV